MDKKQEAYITSIVEDARANWPKFKELEDDIVKVLQEHPGWNLKEAYKLAYKQSSTEEYFYKKQQMKYSFLKTNKFYSWDAGEPGKGEYITTNVSNVPPTPQVEQLAASNSGYCFTAGPVTTKNTETYFNNASTAPITTPMWEYNQAKTVVKSLQLKSRVYGYHLCLGGGVLNTGKSSKDLDLYFLPLGGKEEAKPKKLLTWLLKCWEQAELIGKDHEYPKDALPYIAKVKFQTFEGKRIDVFVLGGPDDTFDVKGCLEEVAPVTVDIEGDHIVKEKA